MVGAGARSAQRTAADPVANTVIVPLYRSVIQTKPTLPPDNAAGLSRL